MGRAHRYPCNDLACAQTICHFHQLRLSPPLGKQTANTPTEPKKLPCRVCDEDEPRITSYRCSYCLAPVCEEHKTSQHCEDCYP